jgi:hypothetical protein
MRWILAGFGILTLIAAPSSFAQGNGAGVPGGAGNQGAPDSSQANPASPANQPGAAAVSGPVGGAGATGRLDAPAGAGVSGNTGRNGGQGAAPRGMPVDVRQVGQYEAGGKGASGYNGGAARRRYRILSYPPASQWRPGYTYIRVQPPAGESGKSENGAPGGGAAAVQQK